MNTDNVKIPTSSSRVYKDECLLCFDSPESPTGLNICLSTFYGFCAEHTVKYMLKTGNTLFLNITRVKKDNPDASKKPQRLAIGVDGGFGQDQYIFEDHYSIINFLTNQTLPFPNPDLPDKIRLSAENIIGSASANVKDDVAKWEGDSVVPTKYAEKLSQLNPDKIVVPRTGHMCSKCEMNNNLWLCLTCAYIGCGRRQDDGSGGNNHMVEHYKETGHPLVVKLGTITAEGKADVYSYPEDEMVFDPFLIKHLEFFGINVTELQKTEKTMAELILDHNFNYDSNRIQESGVDLYGPGYTGLKNLGNTCYMASVMQTLFNVPQFQNKYFDLEVDAYNNCSKDPSTDLDIQMNKLANGLLSGKYSQVKLVDVKKKDDSGFETVEKKILEQDGVPPKMFKALVGKGHPEFSTNRQQDALEFFQHITQMIERHEKLKNSDDDPSKVFQFVFEDRLQCNSSNKVKYTKRTDNVLSLPVPVEKASNYAEWFAYESVQQAKREQEKKAKENKEKGITTQTIVIPDNKDEKVVRPHVPMVECIKAFAESELIQGFYSSAIKGKTTASKITRFATFPDFLVVTVRRFILDGWVPRKLDVFIDNPQLIDLSALRSNGKQPNEELLPEEEKPKPQLNINQDMVNALVDMGFPRIRCERAVLKTNNSGAEPAMLWLLEHEGDADIDAPLVPPEAQPKSSAAVPDELVYSVMDLGFSRAHVIFALQQCANNVDRAVEFIFNHPEIDSMIAEQSNQKAPAPSTTKKETPLTDGNGIYELVGFISHIGSSTACGHYVCHLKKDDKWAIYNDRKVSACDNPPFDMGYIYLYARKK